jgi:hypothetical protein
MPWLRLTSLRDMSLHRNALRALSPARRCWLVSTLTQ